MVDPDAVKISQLPDHGKLSLVATLVKEAIISMGQRQGLRTGLYIRWAHDVLESFGMVPVPFNDIDLQNDVFWPVDKQTATAPTRPGMSDSDIYTRIVVLSGAFHDPGQQLEAGKHLCLAGIEHFSKQGLETFVEALQSRMAKALEDAG